MRYTVFLFLLLTASLCADDSLSSAQEAAFSFYTSNDFFNGSWSVNTDDYLSFGFGALAQYRSGWQFWSDYNGITDRCGGPDSSGTRIDELRVSVGKTLQYRARYQILDVTPEAGLTLSGNLGSQSIQNSWHRTNRLPEVVLGYDYDKQVTWITGCRFGLGFGDTVFGNTLFLLRTGGRIEWRPWYDGRVEVGESASLRGGSDDLLLLDFSYRYVGALNTAPTVNRIAQMETGWTWRYTVQCGGIYINNEFNLLTGLANGSLGLTFQRGAAGHPFEQEDFFFEIGDLASCGRGMRN
jgi:hypothetical protein